MRSLQVLHLTPAITAFIWGQFAMLFSCLGVGRTDPYTFASCCFKFCQAHNSVGRPAFGIRPCVVSHRWCAVSHAFKSERSFKHFQLSISTGSISTPDDESPYPPPGTRHYASSVILTSPVGQIIETKVKLQTVTSQSGIVRRSVAWRPAYAAPQEKIPILT